MPAYIRQNSPCSYFSYFDFGLTKIIFCFVWRLDTLRKNEQAKTMNYEQATHDFYIYAKGQGSSAPHAYLIRFNQKVKAAEIPAITKNIMAITISNGIKKGANYKSISAAVMGNFEPVKRGTYKTAQLALSL